jgi:hypothetical protein
MALPSRGTLGQILPYNGYNYKWTGSGWLNVGQNTLTVGNTSIKGTGLTVGNTSIGKTGVVVGNTSIKGTGLTVGNTNIGKTGVTVGNTSIKGTGLTVGNTNIGKTGVTVGNTSIKGTGLTVGNTSIGKTGIVVGNTSIGGTGLKIGNTSITKTGVSLGTGSITATNYSGTANNALNLGGTSAATYTLRINDRLQVANANAKYTTKAYAASNSYVKLLLANTNAYIADVAASAGTGGGGGGFAADTFDYGSIVTAIDIELNRDYGTL